jgi:hypothetical protein
MEKVEKQAELALLQIEKLEKYMYLNQFFNK